MFKRNHSEIINRSYCVGALMDGDKVDYVLYIFRGHPFRYQDGKLTAADDADRKYIADGYRTGRIKVLFDKPRTIKR